MHLTHNVVNIEKTRTREREVWSKLLIVGQGFLNFFSRVYLTDTHV